MKSNIQAILRNWKDFEWSFQGFGMLRTYLDPRVRLHVWTSDSVPGVSTIHDHPWDFESRIIVGAIKNVLYEPGLNGPRYMRQRIVCGPEGGPMDTPPEQIGLWRTGSRMYCEGETYKMKALWLHESAPSTGTVSLIIRDLQENTEEATVCYRIERRWVSAKPRPATDAEVLKGVTAALRLF